MESAKPLGRNRMMLLLIGGLPATVILAATWLWYFGVHGDLDVVAMLGTANRGALVEPVRQIDTETLFDQSDNRIHFTDLEPRWTMLVPGAGGYCDEVCEKNFYLTRQIHIAMGKEFNRLRRLYISERSVAQTRFTPSRLSDQHRAQAAGDFSAYLGKEHRGLKAWRIAPGGYQTLFQEHQGDPSTWYLVDPAGWIMMSYNSGISYKDVMTDLKFLLKNSGG